MVQATLSCPFGAIHLEGGGKTAGFDGGIVVTAIPYCNLAKLTTPQALPSAKPAPLTQGSLSKGAVANATAPSDCQKSP